jgi:hypothetical protein
MVVEIGLAGRLFVSEIILVCALPYLLAARGSSLLRPMPKRLLLLGLSWLVSQAITDLVRSTPLADWTRGWSKIVFLLLNFAAIYLLLDSKENRVTAFAYGIAIGQILTYFFHPSVYAGDFPWKFGYGYPITLVIILVAQLKPLRARPILSVGLVLFAGALNFYMGFRSLGLTCFLSAWFMWVQRAEHLAVKKQRSLRMVLTLIGSALAVYLVTDFYEFSAAQGWLGEDARTKYLVQSSGDLGILLGARTEILASGQAILDSPVLGHGSWAKDPKYTAILESALDEHGYDPRYDTEDNLIPSHSYIMGAWVEAGIIGAVFWIWAFSITVRTLLRSNRWYPTLIPLTAFIAFDLLWNIPFSPFGADGRVRAAYGLSLMIMCLMRPPVSRVKRAVS